MAAGLKEKINSMSLGALLYLIVGVVVAINQGYWRFTDWDGHVVTSLLTALDATIFWPAALFYTFSLSPR
jgi:hypothetical protein